MSLQGATFRHEYIRPWSEVLDVEGNQSVLDEGSSMAGGTLSHGDRSPMLRELARREACESLSRQAKLLKNQQTVWSRAVNREVDLARERAVDLSGR